MTRRFLSQLECQRIPFYQGDRVSFFCKRSQITGTILRTNPKRALVLGNDGKTRRVPYASLQRLSGPEIVRNEQFFEQISRFAHEMLEKYGLSDWRFCFDTSTRRAGCCNYARKTISVSFELARNAPESDIKDTILHEVAHAIVGRNHHHDAVWKATARKIGCTADRCHKLTFSPPRYIVQCENGCWTATAERRNRHLICRKCSGKLIYRPYTGKIAPS